MLKVLTKVACYIEGLWIGAGTEAVIAEKHFHDDVHVLLEDLSIEKKPAPPAAEVSPPTPQQPPIPAADPPLAEVEPELPAAAAHEEYHE